MGKGDIISDGEILFRYVNPDAFPCEQQEIPLGIFNDMELSCDWKKYRPDPNTSYHLSEGKTRIISITICEEIRNPRNPKRAGEIVDAWKQDIIHDPVTMNEDKKDKENPAHSLIRGRKRGAVQKAIASHSAVLQ